MDDLAFTRNWTVGDKTFTNKRDAQEYRVERFFGDGNKQAAELAVDEADTLIALLRPFATPRTRKAPVGNGKAKGKGAQAAASAV